MDTDTRHRTSWLRPAVSRARRSSAPRNAAALVSGLRSFAMVSALVVALSMSVVAVCGSRARHMAIVHSDWHVG